MGFASTWLKEKELSAEIILEAPDRQTGIIVVIPSYNEPGIGKLLNSLALCSEPDCKVEVIVVVNAPAEASGESIKNNKITILNIETWKKENKNCFFRVFAFIADSSLSNWGVGLARKTGMDEALRRFNITDKPEGVILSLDADCLVEKNYFVSVCNELLKKKDRTACSIYFEHPLSGDDFPEIIYRSIVLYELHLRYYFQGLAFSGFPYVFHTVGSALAVKAMPYLKAGGMNRKQAGEDFYFIQKLLPAGGFFSLNSTTVYPSPRTSFRVPFGTGASMEKLSKENEPVLPTYNFRAFEDLRLFFELNQAFYSADPADLHKIYSTLPESLRLFSDEDEWTNKIVEIKSNTSGLLSFKKRFFGWFNMFRIVKYLNYVHQGFFKKIPVEFAARVLLEKIGHDFVSDDPLKLLLHYRSMEKTRKQV
jgi:hypothetical protein